MLVHVHTCLGDSILRECPSLAQADQRAVGLGCHDDHIYLDLRPMEEGREFESVKVWDSGSSYYGYVLLLQISLFTGMCMCVGGEGGGGYEERVREKVCEFVCVYACVYIYVCVCVCVRVRVCVCACVRARALLACYFTGDLGQSNAACVFMLTAIPLSIMG